MFTYNRRTSAELSLTKVYNFPSKLSRKNFLSTQVKMQRSLPQNKKLKYVGILKHIAFKILPPHPHRGEFIPNA